MVWIEKIERGAGKQHELFPTMLDKRQIGDVARASVKQFLELTLAKWLQGRKNSDQHRLLPLLGPLVKTAKSGQRGRWLSVMERKEEKRRKPKTAGLFMISETFPQIRRNRSVDFSCCVVSSVQIISGKKKCRGKQQCVAAEQCGCRFIQKLSIWVMDKSIYTLS